MSTVHRENIWWSWDGVMITPDFHLGVVVDLGGPKLGVVGDADPWVDLWCYTNPIWVLPG
ncbi:hypothetical protein AB0L70_02010 [Kribbella sp. NPDC051952]|uniref:hypothetical protein n=1 Tax=Kribbella sp. NPDC051952 TaxID=3154851 RepID=UPI0034211BF6